MPSIGKQLMFEELLNALKAKNYVFFARYHGLSVSDFGALRRKLDKVCDRAMVVKNTIARRAFEKIGIKNANGFLEGSVLLTLGDKEPQAISKVLVEFAKGRENFQLSGACIEGRLFDLPYVQDLAALPSRETLLATVVSGLNAPISGLVNVMGQLIRSLAIALDQIAKRQGS